MLRVERVGNRQTEQFNALFPFFFYRYEGHNAAGLRGIFPITYVKQVVESTTPVAPPVSVVPGAVSGVGGSGLTTPAAAEPTATPTTVVAASSTETAFTATVTAPGGVGETGSTLDPKAAVAKAAAAAAALAKATRAQAESAKRQATSVDDAAPAKVPKAEER